MPLLDTDQVYQDQEKISRPKQPVILYVGRLSSEKNPLNLLTAFYDLCSLPMWDSSVLHLVGDGVLRGEIEGKIHELGIKDRVSLFGHCSKKSDLYMMYKRSTMLVLPSLTEGVPRVIAECLLNNCPVLSTDVGGIRSAYGDNISYINGFDSESILASILNFLNTEKEFRKVASGEAIEKFSLSQNVAVVCSTIKSDFESRKD